MRFPLLTKVLAIGAVTVLLCLLLGRIESLVDERRWRQAEAARGIEQSLAGAQTLLGPLLQRSCVEEWDVEQGEGKDRRTATERRSFALIAPPQTLDASGRLQAEARYRGLFKINGYVGDLSLDARWTDLAALHAEPSRPGARLRCEPVRILVAMSDVRGLRSIALQAGGESLPLSSGTGLAGYARGVQASLSDAWLAGRAGPLDVHLKLSLVGTERFGLVPAAGQTTWTLASDWPHPSFGGRFLPTTRAVRDDGFDARWTVSDLASTAADDARRQAALCTESASAGSDGDGLTDARYSDRVVAPASAVATCLDTLGVALVDPVNPYVLTDRATKYAVLFIGLTFGCVALVEVLARRRVHPLQYALVGMALALFYLLLLSTAEHLSFAAAYALASALCTALLGFYGVHLLGRARDGLAFGAGIALLYGLLWTLLRLEQTALLIGSFMLFTALAAVMVLTRRVDWYALVDGWRASLPAKPAQSPAVTPGR